MSLENCEEIREKLTKRLKDEDNVFGGARCIALLLGAGCNIGAIKGCEFPSWTELLKKLSWEEEAIDSSRYLEVAGHIEAKFLEKNRERVYDLFRNLAIHPTRQMVDSIARPDTTQRMAKYVKVAMMSGMHNLKGEIVPGSTMAYVLEICKRRIEKQLRTIIITYNYDDLFECKLKEALRNLYDDNKRKYDDDTIGKIVRSTSGALPNAADLIFKREDGPSVDIFYVHGKIFMFDEEKEKISDRIILSQQSYDILSWNHLETANQIQYVVQAGMPMVSIGFSFDDFNFCRLRREIMSNYEHDQLPPFYSLQYCDHNSAECPNCPDRKNSIKYQIEHIEMLGIKALPMTKDKVKSCFETVFDTNF